MKYLLVLGIIGALLWWKWQVSQSGRARRPPTPAPVPARRDGVPMVACEVCQLNVPEPEAVVGQRGRYCCESHRNRAED